MNKTYEYTVAGKCRKDGRFYMVYTCGVNKFHADKVRERAAQDAKLSKEYEEFIVEQHEVNDCWWNKGTN